MAAEAQPSMVLLSPKHWHGCLVTAFMRAYTSVVDIKPEFITVDRLITSRLLQKYYVTVIWSILDHPSNCISTLRGRGGDGVQFVDNGLQELQFLHTDGFTGGCKETVSTPSPFITIEKY